MLQTLEREPQDEMTQVYDSSPATGRIPLENGGKLQAAGYKLHAIAILSDIHQE